MRRSDGQGGANTLEGRKVLVKLRNTALATKARLTAKAGEAGEICLQLEAPEFGIATGQAGVIYDGEDESLMLGGGWISKAPTQADSLI